MKHKWKGNRREVEQQCNRNEREMEAKWNGNERKMEKKCKGNWKDIKDMWNKYGTELK